MFLDDLVVSRMINTRGTWRLKQDLRYLSTSAELIEIKAGFIFDFASIPSVLTALLPTNGRKYDRASTLHDWLYATKLKSKQDADKLFYEAMLSDGVSKFTAWIFYKAVACFGKKAYYGTKENPRKKLSPNDLKA